MTTTAGEPRTEAEPARGLRGWTESVRHTLDRPLASYYLLLGASALLLTFGLMMVLRASSIDGFKK